MSVIVSSLYDLKRPEWETTQSRTIDVYLQWTSKLLELNSKLVFFGEQPIIDKVKEVRLKYDKNLENSIFVTLPFTDLPLYKKKKVFEKILLSQEFKTGAVKLDHPQRVSADYNILMNSKPFFLKYAYENNFFNSDYYMWLDAGIFRDIPDKLNLIQDVPNKKLLDSLQDQKIHLVKIKKRIPKNCDINQLVKRKVQCFGGGWFGGHKLSLEWLHKEFENIINELVNNNLIDQDQTTMLISFLRNNNNFYIHNGGWFTCRDILLKGIL